MSFLSSRLAGRWYPGSSHNIMEQWNSLEGAETSQASWAVAPHAGWPYSLKGQKSVITSFDPDQASLLVILSPSHYYPLATNTLYFSSHSHWQGPLGTSELMAVSKQISQEKDLISQDDRLFGPEHGLEMLLPGIQLHFSSRLRILPLICGSWQDSSALGQVAGQLLDILWKDLKNTIWMVSSDLTHYGPRFAHSPYGPLDQSTRAQIHRSDANFLQGILSNGRDFIWEYLDSSKTTICGIHPLLLLMEILDQLGQPVQGEIASHYDSWDYSEDSENLVAYGGIHGRF